MHCLWWLRSRRSKPKHRERTRNSETFANSGSDLLPLQRTGPTHRRSHSRSHSLPQTPPSRPLLDDSDSSLSSMSSGSIVRVVPLENPFVTRPTAITPVQQSSHTTGFQRRLQESATLPDAQSSSSGPVLRYCRTNDAYGPINSLRSHDSRMVRSQARQAGPRARDDSPTLPSPRGTNTSFSARLARSADAALPRPTFLDDDSNDSSDDGATHEHDDSGYTSALTTPAKPNKPQSGSAAEPIIQMALIPTPPILEKPFAVSFAQLDIPKSQSPRTAESMCEQRHCLRTKRTCLEHAPTPSPPKRSTGIQPPPNTPVRRLSRRPRVRGSQSFEEDVWMQIAREFSRGS